jgi:hypothetical protein
MKNVFVALLLGATLTASAILVVATAVTYPLSVASLSAVTAYLLALSFPRVAISLALIGLPLGGNRPGTPHSTVTTLVGAALLLGLATRSLRTKASRAVLYHGISSTPLLLAGCIYCAVSLASLSSLPIPYLIDDIRNSFDRSSLSSVAFSITSMLAGNEHTLIYSVLSCYLTLLAYFLGVCVWRECTNTKRQHTEQQRTGRLFLVSILLGLLCSLAAGLLDYYDFINLRTFRPLDPIVNPDDKQFRLQSFFAHSGWYAEYITLTIPSVLALLGLRAPFWVRTTLILLCLAIGEFVLLLTYQRGGWLSYPITLIAVWAALYVVRLIEQQKVDVLPALRRSVVKVLISLPLTVFASLALVFLFQKGDSAQEALSPYVSRFKQIQRTGDRTDFLFAGVLIGSKHPILGGGSDSFAWQFEREFDSPTGSFYQRFNLPLHGSAHNVYAQTFSGKGFVGLVALLAFPYLLISGARRSLTQPALSISSKLTLITGACFACAFLVYGNVQEVFYIQALQFLFFAIIAVVAAESVQTKDYSARSLLTSPKTFIVLFLIHLGWEYIIPGPTAAWLRQPREFGCYGLESPPQGPSYRWCGERGLVFHAAPPSGSPLLITIEAGPLTQTITLSTGNSSTTVSLAPSERKTIEVPLASTETYTPWIPVRFEASAAFVPMSLWPTSADARRLAFKEITDQP